MDLYDSLENISDYHNIEKSSRNNSPQLDESSDEVIKHESGSIQFKDQSLVKSLSDLNCNQSVTSIAPTSKTKPQRTVLKSGQKTVLLNFDVDNETLNKQGLHMNQDGSFTKSPRFLKESLPFIKQQYREFSSDYFSKKKHIHKNKKKTSLGGKSGRNLFTFDKNDVNGISMNEIINQRKTRGSSEEMLTSRESTRVELNPELLENKNLTDSMKEIIMRKNSTLKKCPPEILKKAKRVMNLLEYRKTSEPALPRIDNPKDASDDKINPKIPSLTFRASKKQLNQKTESKEKTSNVSISKLEDFGLSHDKFIPNKLLRNQSAILVTRANKLSYLERHQQQKGFNPMSLKQGIKKYFSDTNRSNYGDSTTEELSEISSRVYSNRNQTELEEEEMFYQRIMQKDKIKKKSVAASKSDNVQHTKSSDLSTVNAFTNKKHDKPDEKFITKIIKKSTSIDIPTNLCQTKAVPYKTFHNCQPNVSTSVSKTELVQKGKAYGCLANARNIFKLKTNSEAKLQPLEAAKERIQVKEKKVTFKKLPHFKGNSLGTGSPMKKSSLKSEKKIGETLESIKIYKNSSVKKKTNPPHNNEKSKTLILPRVTHSTRYNKTNVDVLNRIKNPRQSNPPSKAMLSAYIKLHKNPT